ncbi:hypothetical protein [Chitinimonas sp. BJB300]|uniref:hypothetical protein n=1 Tax=Chitinimonas sp. BJB300 TaxID=1559339 RepID=UPI00111255B7|nr:hypothetical protein [Chitinimonas sp. BJB300]
MKRMILRKINQHNANLMTSQSADIAFVVNLDYLGLPYDTCRMFWLIIERAMLDAGFELDGREFIAPNKQAAIKLARAVMAKLEPTFESLGYSRFEAVREFYCYKRRSRIDLNIADAVDSFDVEEIPDIPG